MEMSPEINELAGALAKAQAAMGGAKKDGLNPHFKSQYATLASVWEAARGPLSSNNLAVIQTASTLEGQQVVTITTVLVHSSGQWIKDILAMAARDINPQSVGSVISYGRRYQLAAMVGIAPEDDDAEAAEGRNAWMKPLGEPRNPSPAAPAPRAPVAAPRAPAVAPRAPVRSVAPPPPMSGPPEPPPLNDSDIPF